MQSINRKLITWFLVVSLGPLVVVCAVIYTQRADSIRIQEFRKLMSIRDLKVDIIDQWIEERVGDIYTIADNVRPQFSATGELANSDELRANLAIYLRNYDAYDELFVIDASSGLIIESTNRETIGADKSNDPYFLEPMRTGRAYIKDAYFSETLNEPSLSFSAPVKISVNGVTAIPAVIVARSNLSETINALLADRSGMGKTGEIIAVNTSVQLINRLRNGPDVEFGDPINADPARMAAEGNAGLIESRDYRNQEVLAAITYISRLDWGIIVKKDFDEVYAPIRVMFYQIAALFLLCAIGVLVLATSIARRISDPIVSMAGVAERIRDGDHKARSEVKGRDEIASLSESLNQMNEAIEHQMAEIAASEKRVRAVIDNAPDAMVIARQDGSIEYANDRARELFGYTMDELQSMFVEDLVNSEQRGEHASLRNGFFDRPERRVMGQSGQSLIAVRKDGTTVPLEIGLSPLESEEGMVAMASIRDITNRLEAERALQEAKEVAEEANKSKSDFLANMSHEIRTPMNAVIGMSQLALKTQLNPKQRDYVEKIFRSGQHLLGIINDILDFSKVEAGKLDIEETDFELEKVLENVANLIGEKAAAKDLELLFDIDPTLPDYLVGDPLRLGQVLINYANNAVKFTDTGEIIIRVRAIEQTETDMLVRFDVEDTGIGLTEDQIGLLFQSFQQADTSTTRKFGGTGLGLAICKKLSELMGGNVGVESDHGAGSKFWFTAWLGLSKAERKNLIPTPDLRDRHVLVVDDNPHARVIISDILTSMTFRVDTVASGEEAIAAVTEADAQGDHYDVVYLDWRMPGMDGIETGISIANLELKAPMPHRIIITAYGREEVSQQAEDAGIQAILLKPVSASLLFDTTIELLGGTVADEAGTISVMTRGAIPTAKPGTDLLLVEDNELNQQVAIELLNEAGFEPDLAENGEIAVRMVRQKKYNLVLMDVQMPVMDGLAATREIRQLLGLETLPIIAMTAGVMASDKDECLDAGMNDHVAKPIDPDQLYAALLRWIPDRIEMAQSEDYSVDSTQAADDSDTGDFLSDISGLDTRAGLRRVLNKHDSYVNLLRKFIAGQAQAPNDVRAALEANEMIDAERIAHTLKGVAGNIGATNLQEVANKLESAIHEKEQSPQLELLIGPVERTLTELINALSKALPQEATPAPESSEVDWNAMANVVARLDALLADDDAEAMDFYTEHAASIQAAFKPHANQVEQALQDYDFETALAALREAIAASPLGE